MEDQKEKLGTMFGNQSWTKHKPGTGQLKTETHNGTPECFGIERGDRPVRRFKLFFRNGSTISIPYAFLPVVIYDPDQGLKIRTGEMEVTVKGRGLDRLADHLNEEKVLWVRESASAVDTGDSRAFVEGIEIDGDLLT